MPGINALRRVQIGQHPTDAGASTDYPTTVWRGMGLIDDLRETVFPDENIGVIGGANRSYVPTLGGEITLEGDATFEQLPYVFDAGILAATVSATDGSSARIRPYDLQWSSTDPIESTDLKTLVVEAGDNQEAEIMRFGFVREYTLSGAAGEALMISAVVEGREVAPTSDGAFTDSLAIPTVETILFSKGRLYIDPSTDTPGTTQKSNTLLSMNLSGPTGWQVLRAADGRLDFSTIKFVGGDETLEITFEHDGTATAEKAHWRAGNERVVRLVFEGSGLATTDAGAPYDTKALVLTRYGKWSDFDVLGESDGNDIVTGTFRPRYSTGAASKGSNIVVNELATLP